MIRVEQTKSRSVIVGSAACEFIAEAIIGNEIVTVSSLDFYGKYVLYFFYANDFSIVCPTEMHVLQERLTEFKNRDVQVVGISTDTIQAHIAWLKTPKEKGGIKGITFPLISDVCKKISRAYRVLDEKRGTSLQASFIADKTGIIQYAAASNADVGRNIDELLRVVDAIQEVSKHGELCPANWRAGQKTLPAMGQ